MAIMQAQDMLPGDEWHNAGGDLVWTIVWGPYDYDRSRMGFHIRSEFDGGETERAFEMDREMPGIVRPIPPEG